MEWIELMIVVAIIGILAAIAIPQYQNYIAKSQVSRVMAEAGAVKTAVEACILEGKTAEAACDLGITDSNIQSLKVAGAAANTAGQNANALTGTTVIEATFNENAAATLKATDKDTLTWTRTEDGSWVCTTKVESKYRPASCATSGT